MTWPVAISVKRGAWIQSDGLHSLINSSSLIVWSGDNRVSQVGVGRP